MKFTKETTIKEILSQPEFSSMKGQFVFSSSAEDWFRDKYDITLAQFQEENPTWNSDDVSLGINRLYDIANKGEQYVYPVNDRASIIYMPSDEKKHSSFALLAAGGAYGAVCTMVEAMPVAAKLNELGFDCFCLNYTTATKECFIKGLMPKPLEDMAAAIRFIKDHEDRFNVCADDYFVVGFSAGGHLAAMWGTANNGARKYNLPNPKAIILDYPLISLENIEGPMATILRTGLLGVGKKKEKTIEYSVNHNVDAQYPPTYICLSNDDPTVPAKDSQDMQAALESANVRYEVERVISGGHGFGLGSATPAVGWIERAVEFMEGKDEK